MSNAEHFHNLLVVEKVDAVEAIRRRLVKGCYQEVVIDEIIGWAKNGTSRRRLLRVSSLIFIVNIWRHLWIR